MAKICQYCEGITETDSAIYCEFCGKKFPESEEVVLLHQIRDNLKQSNKSTEKFILAIFLLTLGTITFAGVSLIIGERDFIIQALSQNSTASFVHQTGGYLIIAFFGFVVFLFCITLWVFFMGRGDRGG